MPGSQQPPNRALSSRSQFAILVAAALAIAILVFGPFRFLGGSPAGGRQTDTASRPAASGIFKPTREQWSGLKVATVPLTRFRPEVVTEGNIAIDEDRTTPVFSPYSGRVVQILAKTGQHVERGAPLMAVEASEIVQGQNDLIAAVAALKTARSQFTLAQTAEQRAHALYLAKGGALKDWQQSQADLSSARNTLSTAEIALAAVRNRLRILGKSDAEIDAIENAPTARMNPVATVLAPIGGTVTQRKVGLGQYINSAANGASDPVYTIGDLSVVWLVANVREMDAPRVRIGEPVEVSVLAYPGRIFNARISWVASGIDPDTHRLPVRADVANPDGALKPMMFARFRIITGPAVEKPAVPEEAVVHRGDREWVWLVRPDGSLAARAIRTGEIRRGMVEVLAGLSAGEKVVSGGSLFIDRAARGD